MQDERVQRMLGWLNESGFAIVTHRSNTPYRLNGVEGTVLTDHRAIGISLYPDLAADMAGLATVIDWSDGISLNVFGSAMRAAREQLLPQASDTNFEEMYVTYINDVRDFQRLSKANVIMVNGVGASLDSAYSLCAAVAETHRNEEGADYFLLAAPDQYGFFNCGGFELGRSVDKNTVRELLRVPSDLYTPNWRLIPTEHFMLYLREAIVGPAVVARQNDYRSEYEEATFRLKMLLDNTPFTSKADKIITVLNSTSSGTEVKGKKLEDLLSQIEEQHEKIVPPSLS